MKGNEIYQFDGFRLETEKPALWFENEIVPLKPKALETLVALVRREGEIVAKNELIEEIWTNSFVEENSLSRNIHEIRKTLKKLSGKKFIETVPRRGYRFTGEVCKTENGENEIIIERQIFEQVLVEEQEEISKNRRGNSVRRRFAAVALSGALFLISFVFLWNYESEHRLSFVSVNSRNIKSIAVLPLKPINEIEDGKVLSLGLTDALISRLGKLNQFAVRPLSSVDKFLESEKDALEFGKDLKVDAVLVGTILNAENHYRVILHLFDVRDGAQIWTEILDVNENDIIKIQDLISAQVAANLLPNLNAEEKILLAKKNTANTEAFKQYLKGRYIWNQRGVREKNRSSIPFFERAVALDPNFALAYLGLADTFAFSYETDRAESALQRAIELDPSLSEAYATRGFLRMFHYWDWNGAEEAFKKAIELSPNDAKSHHWYGVYLSLTGRFDEALTEMQKAHELDPTSLIIMADIGQLYYFAREYDKAEEQLDKVLVLDPNFQNANAYKVRIYLKREKRENLFANYLAVYPRSVNEVNEISRIFDSAGIEGILRYELKKLNCDKFDKSNSISCAEKFNLLGQREKAIVHLEYGLKNHAFLTPFINIDPIWDNLRDDEQFKEILSRLNIPSKYN
jgi:DNA-binding winged helix-turn-helix (wHTH) protein/TolB-like protein/Tfp pilus assembly protein PilF